MTPQEQYASLQQGRAIPPFRSMTKCVRHHPKQHLGHAAHRALCAKRITVTTIAGSASSDEYEHSTSPFTRSSHGVYSALTFAQPRSD